MEKFEIIQNIMEQLQSLMEEGPEELEGRLGRQKPEVELEIKSEGPEAMPMAEDCEETSEDPEEKLKDRLMQIRG